MDLKKKNRIYLNWFLRADELKLIVLVVMITFLTSDLSRGVLYWQIDIMIIFLLFVTSLLLLVSGVNLHKRSGFFWLLACIFTLAVGNFFYQVLEYLSETLVVFLFVFFSLIYSLVFCEVIKNNESRRKNRQEINQKSGLIWYCMRSPLFDSVFILTVGFIAYGVNVIRQSASGKDSAAALIALIVIPIIFLASFLSLFFAMAYVTRKIRKNLSSVFIFSIAIIIALAFIILFLPIMAQILL